MISLLLLTTAAAVTMKTEDVKIINNNKVSKSFQLDYTSQSTCHPAGGLNEPASILTRRFEFTSSKTEPEEIKLSVSSESYISKVSLSNSDFTVSSINPTEVEVIYNCKGSGWDKIFLNVQVNGEIHKLKWQKQCGEVSKFDWGLIILLAAAILVVGLSAYNARNITEWQAQIQDDSEVLTTSHAFGFVAIGSLFLILLFFFMEYLSFVLEILISIMGAGAIIAVIDEFNLQTFYPRVFVLPVLGPTQFSTILAFIVSVIIVVAYDLSKNYLLNNLIGLCFAYIMIKTVKIPSFKVGGLLLGLAFFYDIFWVFFSSYVFGDNVMVAVASGLDLPVKLECPHFSSSAVPYSCNMLGLGDLALPGLFLAFASRFDHINSTKYLNVTMVCYSLALVMCISILVLFDYPQPALLYISPFLVFGMLGYAYKRGEIGKVWRGLSSTPLIPYEIPMESIRVNN